MNKRTYEYRQEMTSPSRSEGRVGLGSRWEEPKQRLLAPRVFLGSG